MIGTVNFNVNELNQKETDLQIHRSES